MSEKTTKPASAFSKYAKGLLSRPTTGNSLEVRTHEHQGSRQSLQDLAFRADNPISAAALSPGRDQVVIAGRDLLKVLSIEPNGIVEKCNLRISSRANINYSSNDVKWGTGATASIVATAASNGSIVTWDLERTASSKIDRVVNGHNRAVNRLDFNPGNGSWLLSASQDGSMKLWDLRDRDGGSRFILHGKAEAVRDVQFNSTNALELAAVYDNGTLQKWDLRNPKIYERKLNAHNGPALTLNWHVDGKHLVTGGRDKMIKVWDLKSDMRKPARFLYTMAPVARAAWRPGPGALNCQIASCAFSMDNSINIWSLRRPYVAIRTFETHIAAPTGIIWKDSDALMTCSKDCTFRQQQVYLAPAPIDVMSHYAFGWSNTDNIAFGLGSRKLDKQRFRTQERKLASRHSSTSNLPREARKASSTRSNANKQDHAQEVLDPKMPIFRPHQVFGIISADDNSFRALNYLASRYVTSSEDPIRACAVNALVSYQANLREKSKSWKLIKLVLEHLHRANKRTVRYRQPSIHDSLTQSRLGDSLIRRDLERLRSTPRLPESGRSPLRGSPTTSFIMPKYADGVPPLALPAARGSRSGPTFIDAPHPIKDHQYRASREDTNVQDGSHEHNMILPSPAIDVGMEHTSGGPDSLISDESSGLPLSSRAVTESIEGTEAAQAASEGMPAYECVKSPRDAMSPIDNREISRQGDSRLPEGHPTMVSYQSNVTLQRTVHKILNQYMELGDVQMCATICLVLADYVTIPTKQVEEWIYCYVELLQRQRLFVTATAVINHSRSELVQSLAAADNVMHTTCSRCKKAVPLVRERGDFWMCPRCQNTVQCIVCGTIVKGSASWCRSCAHTAHQECRRLIVRELEGMCVVPDCDCQCHPP